MSGVDPGDYISLSDPRYLTQWTTLPMFDDGTHGDEASGDAVYTAVLPGELQTHRQLVRYRITATDSLGASVTGPYDDDPQPNFAYFVYDGVPAWTGAVQPGVTAPIIGPRTMQHLEDALAVLDKTLDDADRPLFDALVHPGNAVADFHNSNPWMKARIA